MNKNTWKFKGQWITGELENYDKKGETFYQDHPHKILMKDFNINKSQNAFLYIASLGYYIVYINGQRVGDSELNSDWTVYKKRVYYDKINITQFLRQGQNKIEIELGNGMYNPSPLHLFGKYNLRERLSEVGYPALICDCVIDNEILFSSNQQWIVKQGDIVFNNIYLGEKIDHTIESKALSQAKPIDMKKEFVLSQLPKCKRFANVQPQKISKTHIYDFKEMISGFINLTVQATQGQKIVIKYSEAIKGTNLDFTSSLAGSVGQHIGVHKIFGGEGNPDEAIQSDVFICKEGENHFTNKFTYHSFRYIEIQGVDEKDILNLTATYVHADLEQIGFIQTDHADFNALFDAALRTKLNNVHSTFEDCPRERLGYGGDMVALALSNLYLFDLDEFYKKIVDDFILEQTDQGGVPETAPYIGIQTKGTGIKEGPLLWQFVLPYIVYKHYQFYGDKNFVIDKYPYIQKQMDYLLSYDFNDLSKCCLGDHGSVLIAGQFNKPTPDKEFLGYCTILAFIKTNIKLASIVGEPTAIYKEREKALEKYINDTFKNNDGTYGEKSQTSFAFAAKLELDDPQHLMKLMSEKIILDDYIFNSGIYGMALSYELLSKYGYNSIVEKWLLNTSSISYQNMLKSGNKALAELFEGEQLSLNHAMFASYQSWYFESLGGIQINEEAIGMNSITLNPYFSSSIQRLNCQLKTPYGMLISSWTREGNTITWKVIVPSNKIKYDVILNDYQILSQKQNDKGFEYTLIAK